jgi:hypothetical protein
LKRSLLALVLLLLATQSALAISYCCDGKCQGHNYTNGSSYAWVESISPSSTSVAASETSLMPACMIGGTARQELRSAVQFNALLRATVRIDCLTGVPAGGRYGVKFYVDDVERGGTMRFIRMQPGTSPSPLLPQGDTFGAVALNLPAGQHKFEVKAYLVDGGTMTVGLAWLTAQGAPVNLVSGQTNNLTAARNVIDTATTITDQWAPVTGALRLTNNTSGNVDVYPLAQFQMQGGTPGDKIQVGFGFKRSTDSTYPSSDRTSAFEVPCPLKDGSGQCFWPTIDGARDAINIYDHKFSLPPGDWDVTLWAINRTAGHTTTVGFREIEFVYFPQNGTQADTIGTTTTIVDSNTGVVFDPNDPCGNGWTKIAEVTVPARSQETYDLGEGYIEFLGRGIDDAGTNAGDWSDPDIEVQVTLDTPGGVTPLEWGSRIVSLPSGYHGMYFVIESAPVGLTNGATYKLWVRKRTSPCAFTVCAGRHSSGRTTFRVGKRYMSIRGLNSDASCLEYDLSYRGTPGFCPLP